MTDWSAEWAAHLTAAQNAHPGLRWYATQHVDEPAACTFTVALPGDLAMGETVDFAESDLKAADRAGVVATAAESIATQAAAAIGG
ncbi:MAG: hypothetical protein AAFP86_22010 [Planctomycetota bacterium]